MFRIGQARDIHRLENNGRVFVLGGVKIPHSLGVVSHSDGDHVDGIANALKDIDDIDIAIVNQVITNLVRFPTEDTTNIYAVVTSVCHCIVTCSSQIYIDFSLVSTVVNSKHGLVAYNTTNTEAI